MNPATPTVTASPGRYGSVSRPATSDPDWLASVVRSTDGVGCGDPLLTGTGPNSGRSADEPPPPPPPGFGAGGAAALPNMVRELFELSGSGSGPETANVSGGGVIGLLNVSVNE
jgi:hypothetical protein